MMEQRTKYYHYSKQEKAEVMSSFKGLEIILFGADFLRYIFFWGVGGWGEST